MQTGRKVEENTATALFAQPSQPYTSALLDAVPRMGDGSGGAAPVSAAPIATLRDVTVRFDLRGGVFARVTHQVHAAAGVSFDVSGASRPPDLQLDGFWKAQGMRSSIRDAGWPFAMAVRVLRR